MNKNNKDSVRLEWKGKNPKAQASQGNTRFLNVEKEEITIHSQSLSSFLVAGDCLDVLPVLKDGMKDGFRVIYIDPPYNTGKSFTYFDNASHEDWLTMMKRVLEHSYEMLRDDGLIFISIDDNEIHYLRCILDEIFGRSQFIQNFMWLHGKGKKDKFSRTLQQYILCYAKNRAKCPSWKIRTERVYDKLQNPDNDPRGDWFSGSISFQENRSNSKHKNYFTLQSPSGIQWNRQWFCSKEEMEQHLKNKNIYFGTAPHFQSVPRLKIFPPVFIDIIPPNIIENVGTSRSASRELAQLFDNTLVFDFPKPVALLQYLLEPILCDGDWVLDFFAGSGSTGQAVYECQKKGIDCRVVLVQKEELINKDSHTHIFNYCQKIGIEPSIFAICRERLGRMSEQDFIFETLFLDIPK